jgi:hypothetical protein
MTEIEYTQTELNNIYDDHIQRLGQIVSGHDKSKYALFVVLPAIDMYANAMHGALNAANTLTFLIMLRCACEAIAAISYFESKDPDNHCFNKYIKKGRIYDVNCSHKFKEVTIGEQLKTVDSLTGSKGFKEIYGLLSNEAHFGTDHLVSMLYRPERISKETIKLKWIIGPKGATSRYMNKSVMLIVSIFETMISVLEHYRENYCGNNNRSEYEINKGNSVIPKEYRKMFMKILQKTA